MNTNNQSASNTKEVNQWNMFIHLSPLIGLLLPFGNFVAPYVIWQIKKNELPEIEQHAKEVLNVQISFFIYMCISVLLILVLIGYLLMSVLSVVWIVFCVVGGLKANQGELWHYPIIIRFLK